MNGFGLCSGGLVIQPGYLSYPHMRIYEYINMSQYPARDLCPAQAAPPYLSKWAELPRRMFKILPCKALPTTSSLLVILPNGQY